MGSCVQDEVLPSISHSVILLAPVLCSLLPVRLPVTLVTVLGVRPV